MLEFLRHLFDSDFMPHGMCYFWNPQIVWLHVLSDGVITVAYYVIPFFLVYFVRKRHDLPFHWVFWMFGAFILGCGTTHLMEVWTLWHGTYRLAGVVKALTAAVSLATAGLLVPLIPKALALPRPDDLRRANQELEKEIGERRLAEDMLRTQAAKLREQAELLDLAHDSIIVRDPGGAILFWNRGAEKTYGWRKEEAVGRVSSELLKTRFPQPLEEIEAELLEKGSWEGELIHFDRDNAGIVVSSRWVLQHDGEGRPFRTLEINNDVTERRKAEAELTRFFTLSLDMLCIAGFDGYPKRISPSCEKILGFTPEELMVEPFLSFVHPDEQGQWMAELRKLATGKETRGFESRARCKDGSCKWILWNATAYLGQQLVYAAGRDITERKQIEEELARERDLLHTLMDNVPDHIYFKDASGRFTRVNEAQARWLGLNDPSEAVGRTDRDFFTAEHAQQALADEQAVMRSGRSLVGKEERETWPGRPDTWVLTTKMPLRDARGAVIGTFGISSDITERKRAETEMRELLAAIVQSSDDAIIGTTPVGIIASWNRGAERLYGYSAEEVEGKSAHFLVPPDRAEEREQNLERLRRGEGISHFETVRVAKDGRRIDVSVTISPIRDATGKVTGTASIARDITERKRAEQALRESEARLRQIIDLVPHAIWAKDREGRYLVTNRANAEAYGMTVGEIVGRPQKAIHKDAGELSRMLSDDREVIQSGEAKFMPEEYFTDCHGRRRILQTTKIPFSDPGWGGTVVLGVAVDITELKHAQEALREAGERLRLAQQAGKIGTFDWTIPTGEVRWTEELEALYGLPAGGFAGRYNNWQQAVHPEDREAAEAEVRRAIAGDADFDAEFRVMWPNGSVHWIGAKGQVFRSESGVPLRMIGINMDITERKRAAEEIRKLNEELEERVRIRTAELEAANRELEAFTYSVSHDLRAPLRHIDGFSKLLVEEYGPHLDNHARHYLDRVQKGAKQMGRLVDDLLKLGRLGRQGLSKQMTGLRSLVEEVLRDLRPEMDGRRIEWQIGHLPFLDCDPGLMKQVLANLLSNAVKYTRPRERAVIQMDTVIVDGEPVVFVRDNGVGFNMKYADKLFGVFQRLHRAEEFEGTGVGLATVRRIIHKHGGRVWAESEPGNGSTFYFTLAGQETVTAEK